MSDRARIGLFVIVVVAIVAGAGLLLARPDRQPGTSASGAAARAPVTETEESGLAPGPRIVFRNTAPGAGYGRVAEVALSDPSGPRAVTGQTCDRVAAVGAEISCLRARTGITSSYTARVNRVGRSPLTMVRPGIPSRTRLSPAGTWMASTAFVAGDSYKAAGFSTRTFITSVETGRSLHVEDFDLEHRGRRISPVDRNYWGVTFLDEDDFYVTVAFAGDTWLARGSVRDRLVRTTTTPAECPSVSPDHARVAFKLRQDDGGWRIAVLDVATGKQMVLPGRRSVDDQVAWLDDDTLMYTLPRTGAQSGSADVWAVAADGSGSPRMLIPQAASPTTSE